MHLIGSHDVLVVLILSQPMLLTKPNRNLFQTVPDPFLAIELRLDPGEREVKVAVGVQGAVDQVRLVRKEPETVFKTGKRVFVSLHYCID